MNAHRIIARALASGLIDDDDAEWLLHDVNTRDFPLSLRAHRQEVASRIGRALLRRGVGLWSEGMPNLLGAADRTIAEAAAVDQLRDRTRRMPETLAYARAIFEARAVFYVRGEQPPVRQ